MHCMTHLRDTGHIYLGTVLNKYASLLIFFDLELVLRRIEQVHYFLVVDFNVGALYAKLKGLIETLNFLKEPFHHSRY